METITKLVTLHSESLKTRLASASFVSAQVVMGPAILTVM